MHAVTAVVWARAEPPLHIVQQPQPVTHIGQRNAVACGAGQGAAAWGGQRVVDVDTGQATALVAADAQRRAAGARLHPVFDRVFHQRLQQQRRQLRTVYRRVQLPLDTQPLTKAHLFNRQVTLGQGHLLRQCDGAILLGQRVAKQVA